MKKASSAPEVATSSLPGVAAYKALFREKKLLSVKEGAVELGITERAAWQQIYRNKLPHRRWGGKVVIVASELEKFIAALPGLSAEEALAKIQDAA